MATGLLTGNQHSIDDSILATLELSGLVWVIVLSGYHVTIIAQAIVKTFSFLPKRFALMLAGFCIGCIIFATGASAPSLRGSIMAGFSLFADGAGHNIIHFARSEPQSLSFYSGTHFFLRTIKALNSRL